MSKTTEIQDNQDTQKPKGNHFTFERDCENVNTENSVWMKLTVNYNPAYGREDRWLVEIVKRRLNRVGTITYIETGNDYNELDIHFKKKYRYENIEKDIEQARKAIQLAWDFITFYD